MTRIKWTEEEEKILSDLIDREILPETICKVLGRSDSSVRSKLRQMGFEAPSLKAQINYELLQKLLSPEDI